MDASRCRWPRPKRKRSLRLGSTDATQQRKRSSHAAAWLSIGWMTWWKTFIREHVAKIGTNRRITGLLRRDVIPYWGGKSIHEIKKRDVSDLISLIAHRNAHASHRLLKTGSHYSIGPTNVLAIRTDRRIPGADRSKTGR